MPKKSVLLVDDHPMMRHGLAALISQQPDLEVWGEAASVAETLAQFERGQPDCAIVDISLNDQQANGLDLIKMIHKKSGSLPILVLSMHDENLYAELALQAGAMGYLMKQEPPRRVISALREILEGKISLSDSMNQAMLRHLTRSGGKTNPGPEVLTSRELAVLRMIGTGYRPQQIAEHLCLSVKTVESHRFNIRKKLGIKSSAELIRYAARFTQSSGSDSPTQAKS